MGCGCAERRKKVVQIVGRAITISKERLAEVLHLQGLADNNKQQIVPNHKQTTAGEADT